MDTRHLSRVAIAAALLLPLVITLPALSQEKVESKDANPAVAQTTSAPMQKAAGQSATDAEKAVKVANTLAVCRCGMAFAPSAKTLSFTHEGSQYMVCSDVCSKAAAADPAVAASRTQGYMRKFIAQVPAADPEKTNPKSE